MLEFSHNLVPLPSSSFANVLPPRVRIIAVDSSALEVTGGVPSYTPLGELNSAKDLQYSEMFARLSE